jgi:hypothetical protein
MFQSTRQKKPIHPWCLVHPSMAPSSWRPFPTCRIVRSGQDLHNVSDSVRLVKYILYKCTSIYIYTYLYSLIYMFIIFIMFIYYLYDKILSIIHLYWYSLIYMIYGYLSMLYCCLSKSKNTSPLNTIGDPVGRSTPHLLGLMPHLACNWIQKVR